jgi:hypothetical protein
VLLDHLLDRRADLDGDAALGGAQLLPLLDEHHVEDLADDSG